MCNTLCSSGSFVSHPGSDTGSSLRSPKHHTSFTPRDSFFDFTYLSWTFARYKCRVRLLMLLVKSSLYSSNAIISVASAAGSVVCH